ncbi:SDR family NAD(P)-dependent oxidoreductase [Ruegeria pomeroyi]|uniref:SDR family NAD(P)-dependent oxidoreductase n=1 Tax=Ruegeria pomeroyi TaxID=89184 RepID=A0A9Q3WJ64_9RHOB|nr:SDR family NAD(P)-dependent oxidoreductase [Ruegeria pomeroyi]MCE8537021.1 SDR family NAD(P)-dependent oxidoreductase [Ruegeria pomeroyi]
MTHPLSPPPKKDPQKRSVSPTRPPEVRSRAALHLTAAAAEGRFALQRCADCGKVQYPPRDACSACLSTDLPWQDMAPGGTLIAETTVQTSPRLYFRERMPWRAGTVQLDAGPTVLAHIHGDVARHARVRVTARLDQSGQGVLVALPETDTPNMEDDPLMRALSADPKHRRVLITDARSAQAPALVRALQKAGATIIFAGEPESWRPYPQRAELEALGVQILPMDVTDTASVQKLAGEIGGKTDILINTARFLRPGGVLDRGDTGFARDELEVNYLGLMRLAQAFGPAMCARASDGVNAAAAWVNLLSVGALSNARPFGAYSASQAGAYSLSQSLRAEFRPSGLRVMNVFFGPTEEDDWYQPLPPPRVTASALARSVVDGLQRGLEDVWCGDIAQDLRDRFRRDPKVLEREMTLGGEGA